MSVDQFTYIFSDERLRVVYERYLTRTMAWENFGFFIAVQSFRKTPQPELPKKAQEIFTTFVDLDSIHELGDITFSLRENIKNSLSDPTTGMFDELCEIVVDSLIHSTVQDFLDDKLFTEYVNTQFSETKRHTRDSTPNGGLFSCIF